MVLLLLLVLPVWFPKLSLGPLTEIDVGKGKVPSKGNKPEDIIDPNAPSSTLHKTAQDKVSYLKNLSSEPAYQAMVQALEQSKQVFDFSTIVWFLLNLL